MGKVAYAAPPLETKPLHLPASCPQVTQWKVIVVGSALCKFVGTCDGVRLGLAVGVADGNFDGAILETVGDPLGD